jgi:hypothetical protein
MKLPHWQDLVLETDILPEPTEDGSRIVLWVRGDRDSEYQHWERVGTVARSEITVLDDLCTTAAVSIPARERVGGTITRLLRRLSAPKSDRSFVLPNGRKVEQCGERQTDLILVWRQGKGEEVSLDTEQLRGQWPEGKDFRKLGKNLFLVAGLGAQTKKCEAGVAPPTVPDGCPRAYAEQNLATARSSGDSSKLASALIDVGVLTLNEGDAKRAAEILTEALALTRQLGDQTRESDVLGNLGMAALVLGQARQAAELLQRELAYTRARQDPFAEKLALERLGVAAGNMGNPTQALRLFDQALAVARKLGDRHQEATLLWHQGIAHADLGQRDIAIAKAEEAITLMKLLGKPQAGWYGSQLQKYRMGVVTEPGAAAGAAAGAGLAPQSYLGGSIVASVMARAPAQPAGQAKPGSAPSMLRMAMSATKAMANFVGAGFKTASPQVQQKRLQTCATCEHFTGMRCKICGCFVQVKSRMLSEDCPIGKWPVVSAEL